MVGLELERAFEQLVCQRVVASVRFRPCELEPVTAAGRREANGVAKGDGGLLEPYLAKACAISRPKRVLVIEPSDEEHGLGILRNTLARSRELLNQIHEFGRIRQERINPSRQPPALARIHGEDPETHDGEGCRGENVKTARLPSARWLVRVGGDEADHDRK